MVQSLDDNVGKILDALKRLKIDERTIVIFYSDNGGNMYDAVDGNTATSNRPLRGGKATIYEGGIRIPAIVSWPGVVSGGTVNNSLIQSEDLYPTILEMAGLPVRKEQALDAVSMVPALRTGKGLREAVFAYFPHSQSVPDWSPPSVCIRKGEWKLIRLFHEDGGKRHGYELYNLADDIGERRNLAASQPERVQALDAMIEKFLADAGAVTPARNPEYDAGAADHVNEWKSGKGVYMSLDGRTGSCHLRSYCDKPEMICEKELNLPAGAYALELRIRSWADGPARFFWAEKAPAAQPVRQAQAGQELRPANSVSKEGQAGGGDSPAVPRRSEKRSRDEPGTMIFKRNNCVEIDIRANGLWQEIRTGFDVKEVADSIAFQAASGEGSVSVAFLRLRDENGRVVAEWDFSKTPSSKQKPVKQKPVGGWTGGGNGHARLSAKNGILQFNATGGDPQMTSDVLQIPSGQYQVAMRIKSSAGGAGLLFARPENRGYVAGSGTSFVIKHNSQWQELTVPLERDHAVNELRLDPCTQEGLVEIDWIRLSDADGKVLKEWGF